jgi:hypothetical protein
MPHAIRRRRPDGITELRPRDQRIDRSEWYLEAFTAFLLAAGLFVSTMIPPMLLGWVILGCLCGELCLDVRAYLLLRRPLAPVYVLTSSVRRASRHG